MQAIIEMNVDEMTVEFVDNLKKLFPGKKVKIKVQPEVTYADETEYIMSHPELAAELQGRIESIENKTAKLVYVKAEELI